MKILIIAADALSYHSNYKEDLSTPTTKLQNILYTTYSHMFTLNIIIDFANQFMYEVVFSLN